MNLVITSGKEKLELEFDSENRPERFNHAVRVWNWARKHEITQWTLLVDKKITGEGEGELCQVLVKVLGLS